MASRDATNADLALASSPELAKRYLRWRTWSFCRFVSNKLKPAIRLDWRAELILFCAFLTSSSWRSPCSSKMKDSFSHWKFASEALQYARSSASRLLRRTGFHTRFRSGRTVIHGFRFFGGILYRHFWKWVYKHPWSITGRFRAWVPKSVLLPALGFFENIQSFSNSTRQSDGCGKRMYIFFWGS